MSPINAILFLGACFRQESDRNTNKTEPLSPGDMSTYRKEHTVIKFHCTACSKKIGVPAEFAGRLVKCPGCAQPARVPQPEPELTPEDNYPAAEYDQPDHGVQDNPPLENDLPEDEPDNIWSDDILEPLNPQSPPQGSAHQLSGDTPAYDQLAPARTCTKCGAAVASDAVLCVSCGNRLDGQAAPPMAPSTLADPQPTSQTTGTLKKIAGAPLALGVGLGIAILGGIVWALIVKATGYELGIVAWAIGVAIGVGIKLCTEKRTVGIGVLAAFLALFGILSGKYFIAKWYIMPMLQEELTQMTEDDALIFPVGCWYLVDEGEFTEEFADQLIEVQSGMESPPPGREQEFADAEVRVLEIIDSWPEEQRPEIIKEQVLNLAVREILKDEDQVFELGCWYLVQQGEFTQEFAEELSLMSLSNSNPPAQREEEFTNAKNRVLELIDNWTPEEKTSIAKQRAKEQADLAMTFVKSIGMVFAFIGAFGLFDLLWIALAVSSAYKAATYD